MIHIYGFQLFRECSGADGGWKVDIMPEWVLPRALQVLVDSKLWVTTYSIDMLDHPKLGQACITAGIVLYKAVPEV